MNGWLQSAPLVAFNDLISGESFHLSHPNTAGLIDLHVASKGIISPCQRMSLNYIASRTNRCYHQETKWLPCKLTLTAMFSYAKGQIHVEL